MKYSTSEMFERHLNPQRFEPRASGRVAQSPTIADSGKALQREYRKYRNMGFSHDESRWKAYQHHTKKL